MPESAMCLADSVMRRTTIAFGGGWRLWRRWAQVCALVAVALSSGPAPGAPGDLLLTLRPPDLQPGAGFGETLAVIDGNIVVGEPDRNFPGRPFVGRAHVFDGRTGDLRFTLDEPEPTRFEPGFGRSLSAGEGSIFVGSLNRAYAFDAQTGNLRLQIDPPDNDGDGFASNVAYGSGSLLVSEPSQSTGGLEGIAVGQAHLFAAATGQLIRTIPNPEPSRQEAFSIGFSLAVFGDKLAVGSIADNSFAGRVWGFDRNTGETLYRLENPNPEARFFDWFSFSVAANAAIIAVGANEDATSGFDGSGTVYVFDAVTGALRHTLVSPQPEIEGEFGRLVTITPQGDVLVGAYGESVNGIEGAGRAYLFDGETGSLLLNIPNPEPDVGVFGWSVAASEGAIFVGSPAKQAVYVFETIPEPTSMLLAMTLVISALGFTIVRRLRARTASAVKGGVSVRCAV
jgi:outer membrane protein assembly factor BamB